MRPTATGPVMHPDRDYAPSWTMNVYTVHQISLVLAFGHHRYESNLEPEHGRGTHGTELRTTWRQKNFRWGVRHTDVSGRSITVDRDEARKLAGQDCCCRACMSPT